LPQTLPSRILNDRFSAVTFLGSARKPDPGDDEEFRTKGSKMIRSLLAAIPILAAAPFALAQTAADSSGLRAQIENAQAIFQGDSKALDSLMDDDVTVNHPTNRIVKEKKELLSLIQKGVIRYTSFERFPEEFLFFNDMVVVMGRETVVPAKGAPNAGRTLERRYTNIWMKRNGKWRLTVRHANNVCTDSKEGR
jgi:ketosteroid isomerase-like protein